ncbi:hypothetical protein Tco_0550645 [Tanacetum coccineum]
MFNGLLRTPSSGNTSTVQCYNCLWKGLMLGIVQSQGFVTRTDHTSDDGPSYESAFISEVQSLSIDENNEPMGNVNSGSVDKDTHVPDLCAVEKLARNAYQEAKKQRIFSKQVQTQNTTLTSQIELYKERNRILEGINKDNNYLNEFLEADERAKHYNKQAQSQLKVIQNGNSKKRISTGKDGVVRILPPVSPAEIHAVEKERKARTMFTHGYSQGNICEDLRGLVDAKEIWKAIRTRFGGNANLKKMHKAVLKQQQFKRDSFYQDQGARKKEQKQNCLLTMDDGVVNWGEHTVEEEESNHALMAISSSNEVSLCSKTCIDSYNKLKTLCDEQMNQLEDSVGKPLYSRFTKTSDFKGVPHPLSGDYTPTPQEEIDESLYVYGKKGPQEPEPSVSDDRSSEYSTCQSNDSAGSIGTSSEHSVDLESEISRGFNHANKFVPRSVQLNAGRPNINSVRPNINTGRTNINSVRPNINTGRTNINSVRPNINTGRTHVNSVRPRVNTGSSNVNTDQTVSGKDYSNLLIADSLLKTIWFINAPCYGNEALTSPKANDICCDAEEMRCKFKIKSEKSELDELEKQNDLLKDQLLEASLKHYVELCVLINHECVDKILNAELEKVKKKSFEIQEGLQARIKILEKDVQRCQKQSVDFQLKLQHEKEKQKWDSTLKNKNTNPLDYSWISRMEKLENENVSLEFKMQSLIKERDNVKIEYQKLFDSIKKTRSQTQKEMDELIVHVSEKTYAYGAIRAENQNLLSTISELKTRLEKVEKGKSVNTKFYKTNGSQSLLCVTPLNKHAFQKKIDVPKTEENHVVSKPVTLQTSPTKQTGANQNTNVIRPGMYRVVTTQELQTNKTKSALSST